MAHIPTPLWGHQSAAVDDHGLRPAWALLFEPRLGKTLTTLRSMERWYKEAGIFRVVIVAPKTVCGTVWEPEIETHLAPALALRGTEHSAKALQVLDLYSGSFEARKRVLRDSTAKRKSATKVGLAPPLEVVVINYEALGNICDDLLRWGVQGLVLDEGHAVKTPSALRARAAYKLARQARFRRILSGTPAPNGLIDIYGVWKVLSPTIFGTSKKEFTDQYCNMDPRFPTRVVGYRNIEELKEKAFSIASIVFRKDCFDVPETQDVLRGLTLPESARRVYDTIVNEHVLELDMAKRGKIEVPLAHTLSRLVQLRQLSVGYTRYTDENARHVDWIHRAKMDACVAEALELIEAGEKVVIFHAFRPEGTEIARLLHEYKPLALNGSVNPEARTEAVRRFQNDDAYPVIVVQEQVGSLGIALFRAHHTIFLSTGMSHDVHKQARDRTFEPQKEKKFKLVYIYPYMKDTVETTARKALADKADIEKMLLTGEDRSSAFVAIARGY